MKLKQLTLALLLACAATLSHAIPVTAQNKCDKPVPYKVERKGSTLNTSLSQRTSTSHNLDSGDRIKVGNNVVHTVSSSSAGKTVIICNK
ncbi:MAG: hypothetical protein ABL891_01830 [Burkholderiales bacterium]